MEDIELLGSTSILVVGDLILDHYMRGYTERTSPEAPVPIVVFEQEEYVPGGAANVARNVAAAGATAVCAGMVGADREGEVLKARLRQAGVGCEGIVESAGQITTTKARIVSQGQQVVRLDREGDRVIGEAAGQQLVQFLDKEEGRFGAIIVSDYAKGVISTEVMAAVLRRARRDGIPVIVDPKGRDFSRYRSADVLTPNAREAYEATGIATADVGGLTRAAKAIISEADCKVLAITRGAQGVAIFAREDEPVFLQTRAREVFDVTGAGDTFAAFMAMGCAAGLSAAQSAEVANIAAGIVVSKSGASIATLAEVRAGLLPGRAGAKLRQANELEDLGEELRARGKRIVFTNGCFDFLHAGHVALLQQARELGDVLVLATNTDAMIHRLKGEGRPVIAEAQRLSLLGAIEAVDYLVSFADETPHALIAALKPDVLVKGGNYMPAQVEGHEIVEAYGGEVRLLEVIPSIVTHELLAQRKPA